MIYRYHLKDKVERIYWAGVIQSHIQKAPFIPDQYMDALYKASKRLAGKSKLARKQ